MTILNATVTPKTGYISQDTFMTADAFPRGHVTPDGIGSVTEDAIKAVQETFIGDGKPPQDKLLAHTSKIFALPHLRMAVGGSGGYLAYLSWVTELLTRPVPRSIDELDAVTPDALRRMADRLAKVSATAQLVVCHVGWSQKRNGCQGYVYSSAEDFRSAPINPNSGHMISPPPDTEDPDYADLYRVWEPAAHGVGAEDFHVLLGRNQHTAYRRGRYRTGSGIGGELHVARIDKEGIAVRAAHRFSN